jgi:hypothetical protein
MDRFQCGQNCRRCRTTAPAFDPIFDGQGKDVPDPAEVELCGGTRPEDPLADGPPRARNILWPDCGLGFRCISYIPYCSVRFAEPSCASPFLKRSPLRESDLCDSGRRAPKIHIRRGSSGVVSYRNRDPNNEINILLFPSTRGVAYRRACPGWNTGQRQLVLLTCPDIRLCLPYWRTTCQGSERAYLTAGLR